MKYCNHPFDTQTTEALNQAIVNVAPKHVCYSSTTNLNSGIALVNGSHNMGQTLTEFLCKKQTRKLQKRNYQKQVSTIVKRSRQQQKHRDKYSRRKAKALV